MTNKINEYISIKNKMDGKIVELDIYGDIVSTRFWDEDVTPKMIRDELRKYDTASILEIHVNSRGGDISSGNGMISIVDTFRRRTKCLVEAYIEGMCASMASGLVMCADKIYMADNALLFVHLPLTDLNNANKNDMEDAIELLEKAYTTLSKNYMRHWKGTEEELRAAMEKTSIYTAEEALELGLCDEIINGVKMVASAKGIKIGNETFGSKVSDMIRNKYKNITFEKEEAKLDYDSKLMNYGIDEKMFDSCGISSDKLIEIADKISDAVKSKVEPVEQFVDKVKALKILDCEDITSEMLLDYAKAGMRQPDVTALQNKANDYDKIVSAAKQDALTSAIKAQGDNYNEGRMKKFLDVLSYDEIVDQKKAWDEEAKKALNAGKRVSSPDAVVGNVGEMPKPIKAEDYKV